MLSNELRNKFLDFFKSKNHRIFESSPVVPYDDPTLLFTNAGMNQFKKIFLGEVKSDLKRAASCQKCIRVSGKHNDLEEVGYDGRHHTFFEMLGNWSFGDYYKEEAIKWAWEFLTEVIKLDKSKLYVSVYKDDEESFNIWKNIIGLSEDRIYKFGDIEKGDEENFWSMGDTGPCGPSTEIFYDQGEEVGCHKPTCDVGCSCDRYLEIWNLVFMEFNRDSNGKLHLLPFKSVDTGLGLERLLAIIQNVHSNYETDLFLPIIEKLEKISGKKYKDPDFQVPFNIIADHIRTLTFAIADGVIPSNEGRGYIIRRILRRAARQSRKLEIKEEFLYKLVEPVVNKMGDFYPELKKFKTKIERIIKDEEQRFNKTLDKGLSIYFSIKNDLMNKNQKVIPGEKVFLLHDTYGFPLDLTAQIAREDGFELDIKTFEKLMNKQKERSRNKKQHIDFTSIMSKDWIKFNEKVSIFSGYESLYQYSKLIGFKTYDDYILLFTEKTPFYAESGGQTSDKGYILILLNSKSLKKFNSISEKLNNILETTDILYPDTDREKAIQIQINKLSLELDSDLILLEVYDVYKTKWGGMHQAKILYGKEYLDDEDYYDTLKNAEVFLIVDKYRRFNIMRNHTATHLLHQALIDILGDHVKQSGSFVGPDYLRFDYSHFKSLSIEEIQKIESIVNEKIAKNYNVEIINDVSLDKAKEMGAKALFEDKYSSKVRVIKINGYSIELCGGTHSPNTSFIMGFKIIKEESISSGIRRIEAITGPAIYWYLSNTENFLNTIINKVDANNQKAAIDKIDKLIKENKKLKDEINNIKYHQLENELKSVIENSIEFNNIKLFYKFFNSFDKNSLRNFADQIREKNNNSIVLLANSINNKINLLMAISKQISNKYNAKELLKKIAKYGGGSAGGRNDFAEGGAKSIEKIKKLFLNPEEIIKIIQN